MDIQQYISSGILEQYVLGATTPEESAEVERLAGLHQEIADEISNLNELLIGLVSTESRIPSPSLEGKILSAIDALPNKSPIGQDTPNTSSSSGSSIWIWILGLLSIGLLAALFYFFQLQQAIQQQLDQTEEALSQLQSDCDEVQKKGDQLRNQIAVINAEGNQTIRMKGTDLSPQSVAIVHWNPVTEKSHLEIVNLPTPPQGKQYQLWAIVDGTPVDMGVFDTEIDPSQLNEVNFIGAPQAFAVTLEDVGGSPAPTLDQMYVIGNV